MWYCEGYDGHLEITILLFFCKEIRIYFTNSNSTYIIPRNVIFFQLYANAFKHFFGSAKIVIFNISFIWKNLEELGQELGPSGTDPAVVLRCVFLLDQVNFHQVY